MVTSAHEGLHRIFQEKPEILAPVFGVLGLPFPEKATVDALTTDVTETKPMERRVDTVLRIGPSDGEDFMLAVEVQGERKPDKERSWPYYVSYLQSKYRLPVLLLVVFYEFLEVNLRGTPAGEKWRDIMSFVSYFPGRGTVRETAYLEGTAKGEAKGVLRVLEVRGIPVSSEVRERITTCSDPVRVDTWLDRAGTVTHAEELFADDPDDPENSGATEAPSSEGLV